MLSVFSYGGGVQSTAALVLAAQERIAYRTFLFCQVGADSEDPRTLAYLHEVALPYAERNGLTLLILHKERRDGTPETLYQHLTRPGSRSIGIPVRMSNGAPGRRSCTLDFKVRVVARWLKAHGATAENPATVGLGISLDEWQRMRTDSGMAHERLVYPLIDLRLDRAACTEIIRVAGLPIPPKSACWFCPFHRRAVWQQMREERPALFARAVALEQLLNERRAALGRDAVWFSGACKPLASTTTDLIQPSLLPHDQEADEMDERDEPETACESGLCFL